jgi:hypothetical protein
MLARGPLMRPCDNSVGYAPRRAHSPATGGSRQRRGNGCRGVVGGCDWPWGEVASLALCVMSLVVLRPGPARPEPSRIFPCSLSKFYRRSGDFVQRRASAATARPRPFTFNRNRSQAVVRLEAIVRRVSALLLCARLRVGIARQHASVHAFGAQSPLWSGLLTSGKNLLNLFKRCLSQGLEQGVKRDSLLGHCPGRELLYRVCFCRLTGQGIDKVLIQGCLLTFSQRL